jgi:transaldolase
VIRIYVDTASLAEIEEWNEHPFVSGFTTNPTLMRQAPFTVDGKAYQWAKQVIALTDKPVSIDGPEDLWDLGDNVYLKVTRIPFSPRGKYNLTAICHAGQLAGGISNRAIVSVFCGRIMDTGRNPQPVIDAAKGTGAKVLWASVREPYNIVQAERAGCDIVTVPPAILRKYLDWQGRPLEVVAEQTIAQFERDREGLW